MFFLVPRLPLVPPTPHTNIVRPCLMNVLHLFSDACSEVPDAHARTRARHASQEAEGQSRESMEASEDPLEDEQLQALPLIADGLIEEPPVVPEPPAAPAEKTSAGGVGGWFSGVVAGGGAQRGGEVGGEDELPTLEMVGDRVVGTSSSQMLRLATPDVWKVIAPNGLIVRAGPGDDCLPLGRLKGVGNHRT